MNIKGYIGFISTSEIRGWVLNEDSINERVIVLLHINGKVVQEIVADCFREDLINSNKGDGRHGFVIKGDFSKALEIKIFVKNTNVQIKRLNKSITLLMARQRSGTNVLRRCLSTHNKIYSINEIFDTGIYNNSNFDLYSNNYLELISENKSDLIGSYYSYNFDYMNNTKKPITNLKTFEKYVNFIREVCPAENIIIDIKYNHIRNLHGFITPLTEGQPELFKIIQKNNWKVLNLTRKNYVKTFISGDLALKTGAYVVDKDSKIKANDEIKLNINTQNLLNSINQMKKEDLYILERLSNYTNYEQIDYLEMFDAEQNFCSNFLEKMALFFNVENNFNKSPLLKKLQNKTLKEIVVNYKEVEVALQTTEFYKLLDEKL
jgi:hypothetical protein